MMCMLVKDLYLPFSAISLTSVLTIVPGLSYDEDDGITHESYCWKACMSVTFD